MIEIAIATLLGLVIVLVVGMRTLRVSLRTVSETIAYALIICVLASINYEYEIVAQKFAATFAYDIYAGSDSLRDNSTFMLQYILNIPAFIVTNSWLAAIGTNIVIFSGIFLYVSYYAPRYRWIMLAPAIINFSLFSLRDPTICLVFFMLTMVMIRPHVFKGIRRELYIAPIFLISRPESVVIYVGAKLISIYKYYYKTHKLILILLLPVLVGAALYAATFIPALLGINMWNGSIFDMPMFISEFYESRANRWGSDDGGGSNILGGSLPSYPFFIRYPIQIFSFFVLPLPFEIRNVAMALAFVDSLFFIYTFNKFRKIERGSAWLMFWVYVLSAALFMNNYGNAFRIRLPVYFIMLAGLIKNARKNRIT